LWGGILLWCEGISRLVEEVLENCIIASRGVRWSHCSSGSGQFIAIVSFLPIVFGDVDKRVLSWGGYNGTYGNFDLGV